MALGLVDKIGTTSRNNKKSLEIIPWAVAISLVIMFIVIIMRRSPVVHTLHSPQLLEETAHLNKSWNVIAASSDGEALAAVTPEGLILESKDGGKTWTEKKAIMNVHNVEVLPEKSKDGEVEWIVKEKKIHNEEKVQIIQ